MRVKEFHCLLNIHELLPRWLLKGSPPGEEMHVQNAFTNCNCMCFKVNLQSCAVSAWTCMCSMYTFTLRGSHVCWNSLNLCRTLHREWLLKTSDWLVSKWWTTLFNIHVWVFGRAEGCWVGLSIQYRLTDSFISKISEHKCSAGTHSWKISFWFSFCHLISSCQDTHWL